MAGTKSTNAEIQIILDDIRTEWRNGRTRLAHILEYISKKYGKKPAQIRNYISELNEQMRKEGAIDSEKTRQILLDRYNDLFNLAKDEKDYRTCTYINSKIAEIGGVRHETHQFVTPEVSNLLEEMKKRTNKND